MFKKEPEPNPIRSLPAVENPIESPKQTIDSSSSDFDVMQLESANGVSNTDKRSKAKKRRAKWKKPKDKPKRPLSAYNIFFKEQREIVMQEKLSSSTAVCGFSGLAKFVGAKWKALDAASRSVYEERARDEKKRYYVVLAEWKHGKEQKGRNRQIPPLPSVGNNNKSPPNSLPLDIPFSPFRNNLCCPNLWMNGLLPCHLYQNLPSESPLEMELREFENTLHPSDGSLVDDNIREFFSSSLEDAFDSEKDVPVPVLHKRSIDDSSNVNLLEQRNSKSTAMTRVLQTFDHLSVDEEFAELVLSMEW